jgi:nitrite reductase/ring-hydroxylating ferredoxin subunit
VGTVAVFNVAGSFCATQDKCTHRQGPLSKGKLEGSTVTCPNHGAQFNVCTGAVLRGPAKDPLQTYRVSVEGEVARVESIEGRQVRRVTRRSNSHRFANGLRLDIGTRDLFRLEIGRSSAPASRGQAGPLNRRRK